MHLRTDGSYWHRALQVLQAWASPPSQCAVCHAWPSQRLCEACLARYAQPRPRCLRCALEVPAGVSVCGGCLRQPPALDECWAAVDYGYPWQTIIQAFKFQQDPWWSTTLAAMLDRTPGVQALVAQADLLVPVPLSEQRLRERGYNQSMQLAIALAAQGNSPTAVQPALLRLRDTDAQSGLGRAQRLRNLRGAFAADPALRATLQGRRVVLVDDVMTTGATLEAAAQVLRECDVAHVGAVVLARTQRDTR